MTETVTAGLLVIGDEILSGRTKDKNIGYIADYLTAIGIQLKEVRIVPDEEERIIEAVNALRKRYTYMFTTGGIGPTHDDITADSIAKAFGVPIDVDPRAVALMEKRYKPGDLTAARLRMARIPQGAELIRNSVSAAPGFMLENVIVLAGVPRIMQVMLDDVAGRLKTGAKMLSHTIRVERPEGLVATALAALQEQFEDVQMGSYPFMEKDRLGTHLVLRSTDKARLEEAVAALWEMLEREGLAECAQDIGSDPGKAGG
ncbi:MAG: competence/damage-inducible protein A [Alphaproteobacteria bacterium]|nr:MAG: competence/damage-inducible protein A [Alphaproteobacteria bacterium]